MNFRRFGIGTVQFGSKYGVSNQEKIPSSEAVASILSEASKSGVQVIDTAALYGNSEEVLGAQDLSQFLVVTKTPKFGPSWITSSEGRLLVDSFDASLKRLRIRSVYGLLCHQATDLLLPGGSILWQEMKTLKEKGKVKRIGASVYNGWEIDALMDRYSLDIVQVPINVLDQRLITGGQLNRLKDAGVEIHARSIFLQGLLLMDDYPEFFRSELPLLNRWKSLVKDADCSRLAAAMSFVRELEEIDVLLVGIVSKQQLEECLHAFRLPIQFEGRELACKNELILDPSKWMLE